VVYHVLNRGNYRAEVFGTEGAKTAFLQCLDEACAKTGWVVHAWCLMPNHYHIALETPVANLVEGIQTTRPDPLSFLLKGEYRHKIAAHKTAREIDDRQDNDKRNVCYCRIDLAWVISGATE
jgi:hypothetical protein